MKPMQVRLVGRFRFHSKLQGEHEALLYRAFHSQTHEPLILKGEEAKASKSKKGYLSLLPEGKIYQSMQGGIGIPYMHWCGQEQEYNFIVLEEMECTLAKKLAACNGKLSIKSALTVALQLINIYQYVHFKYFIYNNLHPRHVMLGKGEKYGKLFFIDLSRASRYKDSHTSQHYPESPQKSTQIRNHNMQFSSINYHKGSLPSRRDDMQSLMFFILYLLKGELPWTHEVRNLKKTDFEKSRCIIDLKISKADNLFEGYPELQSLYNYTLSLKFEQKPQYSYYSSTFSQMLEKRGLLEDGIYDWMLQDDEDLQPEQLTHYFDLYNNQGEFLKKVGGETINESEKVSQSIKNTQRLTRKTKNDKQCIIY